MQNILGHLRMAASVGGKVNRINFRDSEIQFQSVKCTTITRICIYSEHYICLFKLYGISINLLGRITESTFVANGQNTRSDFTYMILHICKIIVCILKNHTTFAPCDFTYMTFEK